MRISTRKKSLFPAILIVIAILGSVTLLGCKNKNNEINPEPNISNSVSPFELLGKNAPEDATLLLVNNPSSEQLNLVTISEKLNLDDTNEHILIIPKSINSSISIWALEFKDNSLVPSKKVYEKDKTPENFVLDAKIIRPEGIPQYKIEITLGNSTNEYIFSYDGKNGTPNIEYIKAKQITN